MKTILNCLAHCSLNTQDLEIPIKATGEKLSQEVYHVRNYEEFSCINSSLQCCNENDDCEESVVEPFPVKCQKISEDQENVKHDMTA
jgi:hypothetical protein